MSNGLRFPNTGWALMVSEGEGSSRCTAGGWAGFIVLVMGASCLKCDA